MTLLDWLLSLFRRRKPPPPPPPTGDDTALLIGLHNAFRFARGLGPLAPHPALMASSQAHAADMAAHGVLSHTGSDGSSPFQRMTRAGYPFTGSEGENIAAGQTSPVEVMAAWESDPPHRMNILGPYRDIGVARVGNYWVADFGSQS